MAVILAINSGSSSVKVSAYKGDDQSTNPTQLAEAQVSGLTAAPTQLTYSRGNSAPEKQEVTGVQGNEDACKRIIQHLIDDHELTEISSHGDVTHICHRVVHGGEFAAAHIIDDSTLHHIEELTDLAPLHNAAALGILRLCKTDFPSAKNIAYFDTSFHATIPEFVRTYAIDPSVAQKNKLRKYGFHGISYSFIVRSVATYLNQKLDATNIIALHLGSGASACAIKAGQSVDTSMGLTPLAGLPGATRSGDLDPSLVFHFTHDAGKPSRNSTKDLHITQAEDILNKQSGWKALTGTTDFGKIASSVEQDEKCRLAFELFIDRIMGFIGSYFVKLDGKVDALVFSGGIGEKAIGLRKEVVTRCRCLGFDLDEERNKRDQGKTVQEISTAKAAHKVLVCQTDEQYEMARQCAENQT